MVVFQIVLITLSVHFSQPPRFTLFFVDILDAGVFISD